MVTKLKSTLTLLFALQRAGLYPNQKIVVVAPTKGQSSNFIKKVREFMRESPNLSAEIKDVKVGQNQSSILFYNGSEIITLPYNENALGKYTGDNPKSFVLYKNINNIKIYA